MKVTSAWMVFRLRRPVWLPCVCAESGLRPRRTDGRGDPAGDDCIVMRAIQSPNGDSKVCEDMLVENCTIDALRYPISFWIKPGITLGAYGNVTFRDIDLKGKQPITLRGRGTASSRT